MPLGKDGHIQLFQLVDGDGNPARVSLIAGVYRLAVDALLVGPAGAYAQGNFDSVAVDEANALAMWVRSAVTALDASQAAGSQNVPIAARGAVAAQAYGLQRLLSDSVVRANYLGINYSAVGATTLGSSANDEAAVALNVKAAVCGLDVSVGVGSQVRQAVATSAAGYNALSTANVALLTGAYLLGREAAGASMRPVDVDSPGAVSGVTTVSRFALYANAVLVATDTTLQALQARGALAAQAYTVERLCTDAILRGDDGATYTALSTRSVVGLTGGSTSFTGLLNTNAVLFGRDTTDATMRAIEARICNDASISTAVHGQVILSRFVDVGTGLLQAQYGDLPANIVNGRDPSTYRAAWINSLDCKYDVAAATPVIIPTAMVRTAQGSAVNPVAAVIATLDARGLTNKSFAVTDTAIGTYTVEFSYDGVTYRAPAEFAGLATVVGTVMASNRAIEVMKGFRYVRIRSTEAAGTVTVEMSAMGA